jgi:DNA-directed RNA polymerase subunit M/transcription elongation factor TFIIS
MSTITTVLLTQKADIKQVRLTVPESGLKIADVAKLFKKKEAPELLGSYPSKQQTLYLFGYTKGRAGQENKHELPPPHDQKLFFGDILIVVSKNKTSFAQAVTFKAEEYETFYKKMFGDFEDLGSEDTDEEEEEVLEEVDAIEEEEAPLEEIERPRIVRKRKTDLTATLHVVKFNPEEKLSLEDSSAAPTTHPRRLAMMKKISTLVGETVFSEKDRAILERAIFNGAILQADKYHIPTFWNHTTFQELYTARARQIISNLAPNSYVKNDEFLRLIQSGEIALESIDKLDAYQIFPSKWKAAFEFQQLREKRQLEGNKSMATDKFTCSRCWKKECTYYEMQTRSADEPMTIFITCLNCGKHWRQ